jgi:hypothetical protein
VTKSGSREAQGRRSLESDGEDKCWSGMDMLKSRSELLHKVLSDCRDSGWNARRVECSGGVTDPAMPHPNDSTQHLPLPSDDERGSAKSQSELLSVLPRQHFSQASNGVLDLTFSLPSTADPAPSLSVKLIVDSAPGCGGIAWPAGQVVPPLLVLSVDSLD